MFYVIKSKKTVLPTCQSHCELYDPIHQSCSIYGNQIDLNNPKTALTCENILYKSDISLYDRVLCQEAVQEETTEVWETSEMFEQHLPIVNMQQSNYPLKPDISCPLKGAYWFVSPCGTFGCWVKHERPKVMRVPTEEEIKAGNERMPLYYRSPIPLHNHKAHEFLRSHMVWYVHASGVGEYRVIQGDGTLSASLIPSHKKKK